MAIGRKVTTWKRGAIKTTSGDRQRVLRARRKVEGLAELSAWVRRREIEAAERWASHFGHSIETEIEAALRLRAEMNEEHLLFLATGDEVIEGPRGRRPE